MFSKRHFALFLLFLSSTYAKESNNLIEGQDLPLDRNDEIADMKVYVRQNQEDLQILRLDMNSQEYLHQVLNDNVDKKNKALKSKLEKIAKQLETQVSELKSDLKTQ